MKTVKVDIIIPTLEPDEKLKKLIAGLLSQKLKPEKIIIVNTDIDKWDEKFECDPSVEVHHIRRDEFNHGATRNMAVKYSHSPFFICMTQDAVPADTGLTEKMISVMNEKIKLSYARQLPAEDADSIERITREFNYPSESSVKNAGDKATLGIKTYFCSNVCAAYERETFDRLGGFTETDFNEDMIYASKVINAGYSIAYCGDTGVYHSHNLTGLQQIKRNRVLARSQKLHPEVFGDLKSESEGVRLLKTSAGRLVKDGKWYCIPKLIWISGCKYIGYRMGKI